MEFSYNLANLPESVEGADGERLTYNYLSDGSKWCASASEGPSILYRGSFVYEDDGSSTRISSIAWDEGRISYDSGSNICDEWHVKDHLGSVRAIAGLGSQITGIRELNSYLPFGTRIPGSIQAADNRHRFGGKEEQRYGIDAATGAPAIDLGLQDFGARYYDPFTCRWTTRDPLAGKYLSLSPYNYCANNPFNVLDFRGDSLIVDSIGYIIGEMGSDKGVYYKNDQGNYTYLGDIGGEIDASFIYSNLLDSSIKLFKYLNPFKIKSLVNYGKEYDLKNNKNTIYGRANDNKTVFLFDGMKMSSQDIGNHHYGAATASNVFIDKNTALKQAGLAQIRNGNSLPEWQPKITHTIVLPNGAKGTIQQLAPPYGDDPKDQYWIKKGFDYYDR